jgi:hypothetical protein
MKRIEMSLLLPTLLDGAGYPISNEYFWSDVYNINRSIVVLESNQYLEVSELNRMRHKLVQSIESHFQKNGKKIILTFEEPNKLIIHEATDV